MQPSVFERSTSPLKDRGAGLGVPTATCLALRDQKIIDNSLSHLSIRALSHANRTDDGRPLGGRAGEIPTYLEAIRWGDLYNQLRSLVPDPHYAAGVGVERVFDSGDFVEVTFDDGTAQRFDLAIFADGYRSMGRSLVSPECEPSCRGYVLWRGTLPEAQISDASPFEGTSSASAFPADPCSRICCRAPGGSSSPDREN